MRRALPGILIGVASLLLFFAIFSVWVARQALNTDDWVETSTALIRNPAIQQETATYVAEQIPQDALTLKLQQVLPPRLDPLAPAAAGGVAELAQRATLRALQSGKFQNLWIAAQRAAHEQLVKLVTKKSNAPVVFDLRPMIGQVADSIGVGADVVNSLPPDRGKITIVAPDQLQTARKVARGLRALAVVLVILWLIASAAAVWLGSDRRRTLLHVGLGFFLVAILVLALRRVLGHIVVQDLTSGGASEPGAQAVWEIGTSLLRQIAGTVLVLGLLVMVSASLGGPSRAATRVRGWLAPVLQESPAIVYSIALALLFVLLAIGLLPGSARIIPILIYIVLVVVGIRALRRQTATEAHP